MSPLEFFGYVLAFDVVFAGIWTLLTLTVGYRSEVRR